MGINRYVIFSVSELGSVDFSQIEDDSEYIRKNLDETKCLCEYIPPMPSTISNLSTRSVDYSLEDAQTIMSGVDWSDDEAL